MWGRVAFGRGGAQRIMGRFVGTNDLPAGRGPGELPTFEERVRPWSVQDPGRTGDSAAQDLAGEPLVPHLVYRLVTVRVRHQSGHPG